MLANLKIHKFQKSQPIPSITPYDINTSFLLNLFHIPNYNDFTLKSQV